MTPVDSSWPLFYQQLLQLQQPEPDAARRVALVQRLSEQLVQLAEQHSASVVAQLALQPSVLTTPALKAAILILLYCQFEHISARRSLPLLQATLLASSQTSPQPAATIWLHSARQLQQASLAPALQQLLTSAHAASMQAPPWQRHCDGPLLFQACHTASALYQHGQWLGPERLLQQAGHYPLLEYLADKLGPALYRLGRFARDNSGQLYLCCAVSPSHYQLLPYEPAQKQFGPAVEMAVDLPATTSGANAGNTALQWLPPQRLLSSQWLQSCQLNTILPNSSERPLSQLFERSILSVLPYQSLKKQLELLSTQPLMVQSILDKAQRVSRQQLPIQQLRHAISLLGQDALPSVVAQAELYQQAALQQSGHHAWFVQLQRCLQQALLLLSDAGHTALSLDALSDNDAALLAGCSCLPFYHLASADLLPLSRCDQQGLLLDRLVQQQLWRSPEYLSSLAQLLQHYQLDDWLPGLPMLQGASPPASLSRPQQQATSLLLLSWRLCLAVFCADRHNQQQWQQALAQHQARLGLPEASASSWQLQLIALSQPFLPLPVDLAKK